MRSSHSLLYSYRHRAAIVSARMRPSGSFSDASVERLHSVSIKCVMNPSAAIDLDKFWKFGPK